MILIQGIDRTEEIPALTLSMRMVTASAIITQVRLKEAVREKVIVEAADGHLITKIKLKG